MFTGLIEHIGRISHITPTPTYELTISDATKILDDCSIGDSIAVNGACLTVTDFDAQAGWFKIGLAPETLDRTNLGELQVGSRVNLERAMGSATRYGGHFVQGHVDFTCTIVSIIPDGTSLRFTFSVPPQGYEYLNALLPKGYVTLDGTSLTLTKVDDAKREFAIMLIEHSRKMVILSDKQVGDKVNVEVDTVAKGVEKVVRKMLDSEGGEGGGALAQLIERTVRSVLKEKGL